MRCLIPVILCGGSGTRLWPLSRATQPKQFVDFEGGKTLFQHTVERAAALQESLPPIIVSNRSHAHLVLQNLAALDREASLILEPEPRNTAPAIALAALAALSQSPEAILLVLPSDHLIRGAASFQAAVSQAVELARSGFMVTFGIVPTEPATGFGYIKQGEPVGTGGYRVARFVEKPCQERASAMLEEGGYHWNSGMFVFGARAFINELEQHAPDICAQALRAFAAAQTEVHGSRFHILNPDAGIFHECPSDSVDYAVMEKTQKAAVIPLNLQWNDLGAWSSFYQLGDKDAEGNVIRGDVVGASNEGCYINATSRLVAAIGLKDLAVVETKDAVFVAPLARAQETKEIVGRLKSDQREEAQLPPVVTRFWGSYESLARGDRYQTKRIIVNPGEQLSLQLHHRRSEHWTVVEGRPHITVGEVTKQYGPDSSVYIPKECLHRLINNTGEPVIIIEVQCGDYLGEDDIVRVEDVYGRK
ncbi:MAG: mannose-1-phosphate guanylyltransferase/mannose-6-phosphate isomerase [Duodenibacillus sp.]|nr:mannose-1-phosphate guanylyltransferase/mannose-6-phosphate isomerase [Oscillospiraceae bacterium]MCF0253981.1 mannose-1-phosphate guanylyltransferase/mannose-6-phosphate isomerase [Duodenibacillus sp.]